MALAVPKSDVDRIIRRLNLKTNTFDALSRDEAALRGRVEEMQVETTALVQGMVGSSNYATITEPQNTRIRVGEELLVCAAMLEELVTEIAGEPDVVTRETADLAALEAQIARFLDRANLYLQPYITSDDETRPDLVFSIGTTGVDEVERDDYDAVDYGDLEDG